MAQQPNAALGAAFDSPVSHSSASSVYSAANSRAAPLAYGGGGGVIGTRSVASSSGTSAHSGGVALFPSWSSQSGGPAQSGTRWVMRCLRKGASPASLDWESVGAQVAYSVTNPQAAYKMTQLRKQNKNHWARDDPGVLMAALAASAACAVAWNLVVGRYWSPIDYVALVLQGWMQLALAVGLVMGFTRARREALTRPRASVPHMAAPALEWAYVAETAVNAYFPLLLCAHVGLLLTAPISLAPGWAGTVLGNALLAVGAGAFWHCVFRGFLILPFIQEATIFLLPASLAIVVLGLATVFNVNCARLLMSITD